MSETVATGSRLMNRQAFEAAYHPLKWKTALGWEKDGIVRFVRIGRRCYLRRDEIERLITEGGKQFANGWRREPGSQ